MDDGKIIDLYLSRDESAIRETQQKYGARLRALSRRITGSREDAEECESDTYLNCWNNIPPREPRDHFAAFLFRIIRNLSIDRIRKTQKERERRSYRELSEELTECVSVEDFSAQLVREEALAGALNRFLAAEKPENRRIFVRRYFFFDPVREIADRSGISESKVKTTLFRMRNTLRSVLKEEEYEL